jgi:beta-lactamase regulating signal transducer with metallopeptidase domain
MIKQVLFYFLLWLILSISWCFISEKVTKQIFPGFDAVELWLMVLISGLAILFLIFTIAEIVIVVNNHRKKAE